MAMVSTALNQFIRPLKFEEPLCLSIDFATLRDMPLHQLWVLSEALHTLDNVALALGCQPYLSCRKIPDNDAGFIVGDLQHFVRAYRQEIANVAYAREPKNDDERNWRAWTVLGFEVSSLEDLATLATIAGRV